MTSIINQAPYLRTTREYPEDNLHMLSLELNKSYLDIANCVNNRTIGLFPTTRPAITGNSYFVSANQRQQSLRQVYTFTAAGSMPHGLNMANISGFVAMYGTFTDDSVWYPLPYVDATAANNQVSITVTTTNIVITAGGGSPPTITRGFVILEWISNP